MTLKTAHQYNFNFYQNANADPATKDKQLEFTLKHLLIHHQVALVFGLFHSQKFGDQLRDQYRPLYFAVRMLMPDANDYSSKFPPEIRETVNLILIEIYRNRDFYYNRA